MDEDGDGLISMHVLNSIMDDNFLSTDWPVPPSQRIGYSTTRANNPFWSEFAVAMRKHWAINQFLDNSGATNRAELQAQFDAIQQNGASTCKKKGDTGKWKRPNQEKEIDCDYVCNSQNGQVTPFYEDCEDGADEGADFCAEFKGGGANDGDVMIVGTGMIK